MWLETHQDEARQLSLNKEDESGYKFTLLKTTECDLEAKISDDPLIERVTLVHFED